MESTQSVWQLFCVAIKTFARAAAAEGKTIFRAKKKTEKIVKTRLNFLLLFLVF